MRQRATSRHCLMRMTDAKNSLVQQNGYMPRQWVFGLIPRVPGHMLEENLDLPNLDPEVVQKDYRDAPQMSNGGHRDRGWRSCLLLASRDWCASSPKSFGWDKLGSSELKEEMSGCRIVRQLSSVQRSSYVWHHPQSERCERC